MNVDARVDEMINIVAEMVEGEDLGCFDDDPSYVYGSWNECIEHKLQEIDPDVRVNYGISKLVVIPSFGEVVVKLPFRGTWWEKDNTYFDEEEQRWVEPDYDEVEYEFSNFCYGGGEDNDDYCALEVDMYNDIVNVNTECSIIFPYTAYYKTVNGVKFYIQTKCMNFYDVDEEEVSDNSKEVGSKLYEHSPLSSKYWVEMLVEKLGETLAGRIMDFIDDYGINDLHNNNIGFDMNTGLPMIIDFCGFDS